METNNQEIKQTAIRATKQTDTDPEETEIPIVPRSPSLLSSAVDESNTLFSQSQNKHEVLETVSDQNEIKEDLPDIVASTFGKYSAEHSTENRAGYSDIRRGSIEGFILFFVF